MALLIISIASYKLTIAVNLGQRGTPKRSNNAQTAKWYCQVSWWR